MKLQINRSSGEVKLRCFPVIVFKSGRTSSQDFTWVLSNSRMTSSFIFSSISHGALRRHRSKGEKYAFVPDIALYEGEHN